MQMRKIKAKLITDNVAKLCMDANYKLSADVEGAILQALKNETGHRARYVLKALLENIDIARNEETAICQDTGMAIVFVSIGQNIIVEGNIGKAINKGVKIGYEKGFLRKSVVADPLRRVNTGDNTPAVIHYEINDGDKLELTVVPKGFGSENMGAVGMLKPSDGEKGVIDFIVQTVKKAASNPCPPIIIGIGMGGTMEKAAILSKKAMLVPLTQKNEDNYLADLENKILKKINL